MHLIERLSASCVSGQGHQSLRLQVQTPCGVRVMNRISRSSAQGLAPFQPCQIIVAGLLVSIDDPYPIWGRGPMESLVRLSWPIVSTR